MKYLSTALCLTVLFLPFISCDEDEPSPIQLNAEVTISNTLQTAAAPDQGGTGGMELPIEAILGVPEGTFTISTAITNDIEYDQYLDGLYDIDLSQNEISYNLVAPVDHPIYSNFFRIIEANTFDRYYFKFAEEHNVRGFTSDNSSASLTILSESELVVVISEGFNFNPGSSFTISLN